MLRVFNYFLNCFLTRFSVAYSGHAGAEDAVGTPLGRTYSNISPLCTEASAMLPEPLLVSASFGLSVYKMAWAGYGSSESWLESSG